MNEIASFLAMTGQVDTMKRGVRYSCNDRPIKRALKLKRSCLPEETQLFSRYLSLRGSNFDEAITFNIAKGL